MGTEAGAPQLAGRKGGDLPPSLSRSGFDTLLTSILISGLGLVSGIAIARSVGPVGKGRFELLVATGAMLSLFLGLQLPVGITYVVARARGRIGSLGKEMMGFAMGEGIASVLLLWAAYAIFRPTWDLGGSSPLLVAGMLIAAFVVFNALANLWRAVLIGRQQMIRANRRDLAVRALNVALIVAIVMLFGSRGDDVPPGVLYATVVFSALVSAGLFMSSGRVRAQGDAHGKEGSFKEAVGFALPSYFANVMQVANYKLDLFFVAAFASAGAVGIYTIAVALAQLAWFVPQALAVVVLPSTAASQQDLSGNSERAAMGARIALWGSAAACASLAVVCPWVITPLFGDAFAGAYSLLLWLIPGTCLLAPATVLASFVAGVGKPRFNLMVSAAGFVVTVGLDLALIPSMGAKGAAIASTVSYSVSAVLMVAVFLRLSTARLSDVILPRKGDLHAVMQAGRSAFSRRDVQG